MKFDSRIVATSSEYADKIGVEIDYDGTGGDNKMSYEESESIQRILTCQLSVEALINSHGVCGSNSDTMNIIFSEEKNKYSDTFGKTFKDFNSEYF